MLSLVWNSKNYVWIEPKVGIEGLGWDFGQVRWSEKKILFASTTEDLFCWDSRAWYGMYGIIWDLGVDISWIIDIVWSIGIRKWPKSRKEFFQKGWNRLDPLLDSNNPRQPALIRKSYRDWEGSCSERVILGSNRNSQKFPHGDKKWLNECFIHPTLVYQMLIMVSIPKQVGYEVLKLTSDGLFFFPTPACGHIIFELRWTNVWIGLENVWYWEWNGWNE